MFFKNLPNLKTDKNNVFLKALVEILRKWEKYLEDKLSEIDGNTTEIQNLQEQINVINSAGLKRKIVDILPTENIEENVIYMVPKETAQTGNYYNEFIYTSNGWELIGDTQINLTNYYTKTQVDNTFLKLVGGTITGDLNVSNLIPSKLSPINGNLYVTGVSGVSGLLSIDVALALGCRSTRYLLLYNTDIRPAGNVASNFDLGTSSAKFKNGYFSETVYTNDVNLGGNSSLTTLLANKTDTNSTKSQTFTNNNINIINNNFGSNVGLALKYVNSSGVEVTVGNIMVDKDGNTRVGATSQPMTNGYFTNLYVENKNLKTVINSLSARLAAFDSGESTVI